MRARPIALVLVLLVGCTATPEPSRPTTSAPTTPSPTRPIRVKPAFEEFAVPLARPHDVAPAPDGRVWYTGQGAGAVGLLDPRTGRSRRIDLGEGSSPHGVIVGPGGDAWITDSGLNAIVRIDQRTFDVSTFRLPGGGARRVWSDSRGMLWVTEWYAGKLARYDPSSRAWREWMLPGADPQPYAVYVDAEDYVWITDFGSNALVRFDPGTERFRSFPFPTENAEVRQLLGRAGEVWGAESGTDKLVVLRTAAAR